MIYFLLLQISLSLVFNPATMLIRFTVANFMSFKEKTEFNFLTADEVTAHDNHVFKSENGLELTRFAALYGANG